MSDYNRIANLEAENAKLRELVKEFVLFTGVTTCILDCDKCRAGTHCESKRLRALVAKAREVVK